MSQVIDLYKYFIYQVIFMFFVRSRTMQLHFLCRE